ncbi:MAG: hemerythrin domain-containing protein, partial [Novosphingobium sp.]
MKADHRKAEQLFARYAKAKDSEKRSIIEEVCRALTVHTMLEEEVFYPACREEIDEADPLDEAQVEHDSAKLLIADLMAMRENDPFRDAKVKVLAEQVRHHVAEEEEPKDGIFAKAQAKGIDTPDLAEEMLQLHEQLEDEDRLPAGQPVSIRVQGRETDRRGERQAERQSRNRNDDDNNDNREEYNEMASYQQRGRER